MSNEEWDTCLPENEVELKNLYVKVLRELNLFPYKNDVLDENFNLLVKVNSKAQR